MKVGELKNLIGDVPDDFEVGICVNTPAGWVCPDGAVVGIKSVHRGIDWHGHELLMVPCYKLDIHSIENWSSRKEDC